MPNGNYAYQNITISGLPGGGSTTLLRLLKEKLKLDGWRGFSGGEFMRAYAAEKGFDTSRNVHHSSVDYEDDFDRKVDYGMREKLQNQKKWILESWLSGFLAQGVDATLKILVFCSDDAVRIDRIVNRDAVTVDEAKEHLGKRYRENLSKWSRMYAEQWQDWVVAAGSRSKSDPIDFWHPALYDITIDTFSNNQEETLKIVLDAIQKKKKIQN